MRAVGAALLALGLIGLEACGTASATKGKRVSCDVTVERNEDLEAALAGSAREICLAAGVEAGPIVVRRSLTLRGKGASLTGPGRVIDIVGDARVLIDGLTVKGGNAEIGGGLRLTGAAEVTLNDVVFEGNSAEAKGGAIYADGGTLHLMRVVFRGNTAPSGGAVYAGELARVRVSDSLFAGGGGGDGGAIYVHDGADVELRHVTVTASGGNSDVHVRGTTSRAPKVVVSDAILERGFDARPDDAVTVKRSAFGPDAVGFVTGGGNVQGALVLDAEGRPGAGSVAVGIANGSGHHLGGEKRKDGKSNAGAW